MIGMTEDELESLDTHLMDVDNAMSIDETHGYLTALLASNSLPSDSQWLATVLGNQNLDNYQTECQLLLKMKADIQQTLESSRTFEPLYIEVDDEDITYLDYSGWCHGFMYGLSLHDLDWESVNDSIKDLLAPIGKLALSEDEEDENDLSDEEYTEMIEMIPGSIAALYQYWHQ